MKGLQKLSKWKQAILFMALCIATLVSSSQVQAEETTEEVTIYGLGSKYLEKIAIPENVLQSYQIPVTSEDVVYKISSGNSYAKVSDTGLVTPKYTYWKKQSDGWYWSVPEGQEYDYYDMDEGTATVTATVDDKVYTYTVHVKDYTEEYCNQVMDTYLAENITEDMSDMDKMKAIARFPAGFDYSAYYSGVNSMIVNGGGDCWASTDAIITLCEKLGIKAWVREGKKDPGAGSGHKNAMAELNGKYYELEAGYSMSKGSDGYRPYNVTERTSLFSCYSRTTGLEIYQYDGYDTTGTLVIPETIDGTSVTAIDKSAFASAKFSEITLPDTLTTIEDFAFSTCKNLTSIEIPASVTTLGSSVFVNCTSLDNIAIASDNPNYKVVDQVIYSKDGTTLVTAPVVGSVTIPDTVTAISQYAFYYNKNLTEITIPESVETLGDGAFYDCTQLTVVYFEGSELETIGNFCFAGDSLLATVQIPASVTAIGADAFAKCSGLKSIYFAGDVPSFGGTIQGNYYDEVFTSVTATAYYPEGNTTWETADLTKLDGTITWSTWNGKDDMASGDGTNTGNGTTTGDKTNEEENKNSDSGAGNDKTTDVVKEYYNSKTGITVSVTNGNKKNATLISMMASKAKGKVVIPNTVKVDGTTYTITAIGKNAFKGNKKITSVKLGNKIKTIGAGAFSGCKKLKSVTIGKNVKTIGDKAFYKCTKLTKITIPSKVSLIGKQAFYGCKKLKSITIKTKKLTKNNVGKNAFKGIHSRATIKVPKSKQKSYKTMMKKKGIGKKVTIQTTK